ncbi:WecB/TagA/CpsF family glycosyl transferase [Ligilactobacillus salitolerans]|uniref:N-acetylglucosaminyldiphosphoundecaprenol N-acetyl-beta-D-mannosaminyltransferase n=1 Tax=Ligilactobacillus salitolerans TaxID=1808352 RepID=A0A401IW02_9LACO|nr:WecB/TagA/CpsF family glycosyltransferase [Ligilactobacillus salitolerans]GBG95676.1 WecB/TagA/CpsF family glycosyl transferase [Ligilactobacillus salitolerans]
MSRKFAEVSVLGVDFIQASAAEFLEQIHHDSCEHQNKMIVTANPEIVLTARADAKYAKIVAQADYTTADGIGIIKGSQILGHSLPERITGYDTMLALLSWAEKKHKKVFLLGAKPEVIKTAVSKVQEQYPKLEICGFQDGYYTDEEQVAQQIKAAQPDFVFAALGFPKQEYFIAAHRQVAAAIWMGVGGSFDVLAGVAKRAPHRWQKYNLEWLYRLLKEPTRIGRMLALPKYLGLVFWEKFTHR